MADRVYNLRDSEVSGTIPLRFQDRGDGSYAVAIELPQSAVGTHANAWNAAAVAINGLSAAIDAQYHPFLSVFGNSSAAATITLQYSQNNTNYYDGPSVTLAGAGDFRIDATVGARYVRLKSSAAATITATIAGKQ